MEKIFISIAVFVIVVVIHEVAHGWVAFLMGDHTARDAGRLTLNPAVHVDLMGSIILPALLVISRSPVIFGWAKPVPVNPMNFRNPRAGLFLTSFAGPMANMVLAVLFAALFKTGLFPPHSLPWYFLLQGVIVSLVLGFFNLIPIPPLDGANVVMSLLPYRMMKVFAGAQRYGFIVLIVLLYAGLLDRVIVPLVRLTTGILLG